jgi:NAD-dependent protein deacetylase/lipoamidase
VGVVGVEEAACLVAAASRITVLTGAGISTDSGIPDFRGPAGVWTLNPAAERLSTYEDYLADPDVRRTAWLARRDHPVWTARPNAGHQALVDLERAGRLHAIITQNIDGLHQAAGSDAELVIEVHGNMFSVVCLRCGDKTAMTRALQRVADGEADPACLACGGILKSDTISFGQALDELTIARAFAVALECDLFLAVGTSLQVYPVAGLVEVARRAGARVVIVNAERTPYDAIADAVVREPIGTVLPRLIAG